MVYISEMGRTVPLAAFNVGSFVTLLFQLLRGFFPLFTAGGGTDSSQNAVFLSVISVTSCDQSLSLPINYCI